MSSILKALKKLEHEKAGHFPESINIDLDILRSTDTSRNFSPLAVGLLLLMVFGGGTAVTYFFMKETGVPQTAPKPLPAIIAKTLPAQIAPPVIKTETLPLEIVVVPARQESSGEVSPKEPHKAAVVNKTTKSVIKKSVGGAVSAAKPKDATHAEKRGLPAATAVTTVPTLRVNGIAFQNGSADSMAIVNGVPVSSGALIEGITVEEVRKDRVLFQRNGEKFEIQLGQSNQ